MGIIPEITNALGKPVAEQTQDFFVVFESIAATTPEIIDNSSYKIIYLVDGVGNISKPSENADSARNVIQNFELDNKVTVIIDQDTNENNSLAGEHIINAIGKPIPYLYSQNGIPSSSYEKRLVFRDPLAPPSGAFDPVDNYAGANMIGLEDPGDFQYPQAGLDKDALVYSGSEEEGSNYYLAKYPTVSSSADITKSSMTGSNGIYTIQNLDPDIESFTFEFSFRIKNNYDAGDGSTYDTFQEYFLEIGNYAGPAPGDAFSKAQWSKTTRIQGSVIAGPIASTNNAAFLSTLFDFNTVIVNFTVSKQDIGTARSFIVTLRAPIADLDHPVSAARRATYNLQSLTVRSQTPLGDAYYQDESNGLYFETGSYGTNILKASVGLSRFVDSIYVDTLSQQNFGFDSVVIPFSPQPGDRIRFQYNEDQLYTVYNVIPPSQAPDGKLTLTLSGLPPTSSYQNFQMYRIDDSLANNIILDVKKVQGIDDPSNPFTGIITPQFPSQNILDNSNQILEKLKAEGIIKN